VIVCLSACVQRVDRTRVTLFDRSELAVAGASAVPAATGGPVATGLVDSDLVLPGRPADVLAVDGDRLHMRLAEAVMDCRRGRRCDRGALELRIDTPLANVRSIHAASVVASHHVIPLGIATGTFLTLFGGGMIAYDVAEHSQASIAPAVCALAFGLTILAIEIHARLARDTVTEVR